MMQERYPHDIVETDELKKLKDQFQETFLGLSSEEAAELRTKTPEERAAWIKSRTEKDLDERRRRYEEALRKNELSGRGGRV